MSDNAKGIAFEFANSAPDSPCISIAVEPPGDQVGIMGRKQVNDMLREYHLSNSAPILAFWKLQPLPDALKTKCNNNTADATVAINFGKIV